MRRVYQLRPESAAAVEAVRAAVAVVQARKGAGNVQEKGKRDVVTETDVASEDTIRAVLTQAFPGVPVVGEERGGDAVGNGPYWLVDPICGTQNFAADLPLYVVNVALVEDGRVTASVIGDGATGNLYVAERGAGAWTLEHGRSLAVSARSDIVALDAGKVGDGDPVYAGAVYRVLLADRWLVRLLGSSVAFLYVAMGRLAAAANLEVESMLHLAAGCLLAEEAGATVTDLEGRPWSIASRTFLAAATPEIHRELLSLVRGTAAA